MTEIELGRVGVWTWAFDQHPWAVVRDALAEIEDLGYGTIWFGEAAGRDAPTQSALALSATKRIVVAPGIANIYRHDPATLAQSERAKRVQQQFAAGADHVCVSIATADPVPVLGLAELRELAAAVT